MIYLFLILSHIMLLNEPASEEGVHNLILNKLDSIETVSYEYNRFLDYKSSSTYEELTGIVFLDFGSNNKFGFPNYYIDNSNLVLVYNGSERFDIDKSSKTMQIFPNPDYNFLESFSFFYNSLLTVKRGFPNLVNKNIPFSLDVKEFDNTKAYVFSFELVDQYLDNFGEVHNLSGKGKIRYNFYFSYNDLLPLGIETSNFQNDTSITKFDNIVFNSTDSSKFEWFYSSYLDDYQIIDNFEKEIKLGDILPLPFKLLNTNTGDTISIQKGQVTLVHFWISNCSYSIESFNYIRSYFNQGLMKESDLSFYSINPYEEASVINSFSSRQNLDFPVYKDLSNISEEIGLNKFPFFLLLGPNGNVLYFGSWDEKRIFSLIR
ncbi:TlpA family protein disulfide reductase [Algoriphagus terrigena]|uniref:TlpA family protein disulfide reductase n=1 Tax=Algoriphagus terrigena TaxID=344884 RepID=UPI00047E2925|nr:hypothetical protein [Algoriphagus terrigena]